MSKKQITIYHSPDADDAFMFYGFVSGEVSDPDYEFVHDKADIESLNQRSLKGELEVSAASVHAYAYTGGSYAILRCAASFGGSDYGPRLVSRSGFSLSDGVRRKLAIPGKLTSAALALQICLKENGIEADLVNMHFDAVQGAVLNGEVDAGLIIHEGQITHYREGLVSVLDLGEWWWKQHSLPLPLGVNIINRSLGREAMQRTSAALKASIEHALKNRSAALDYALSYGRGISREDADQFVGMYVNERAIDMGDDGAESIGLFLNLGYEYGIIPQQVSVDIV